MIFGFNTDVPGKDAVYHVQTEDRGAKNPVIESMIYVGGKILGRRRTPYKPSELSREKIEDAVRKQHKELVESIRSGTWVPSNETVQKEPTGRRIYTVELLNSTNVLDGDALCFRLAVRDERGTPASGVSLDCRWMLGGSVVGKQEASLGAGQTEVRFPVPDDRRYAALLVCAKGSQGRELAKFHVRSSDAS